MNTAPRQLMHKPCIKSFGGATLLSNFRGCHMRFSSRDIIRFFSMLHRSRSWLGVPLWEHSYSKSCMNIGLLVRILLLNEAISASVGYSEGLQSSSLTYAIIVADQYIKMHP